MCTLCTCLHSEDHKSTSHDPSCVVVLKLVSKWSLRHVQIQTFQRSILVLRVIIISKDGLVKAGQVRDAVPGLDVVLVLVDDGLVLAVVGQEEGVEAGDV